MTMSIQKVYISKMMLQFKESEDENSSETRDNIQNSSQDPEYEPILAFLNDFFLFLNDNNFADLELHISKLMDIMTSPNLASFFSHHPLGKNFITTSTELLINPPTLNLIAYINLFLNILSIDPVGVTTIVIENPQYISFFDSVLFCCNELDLVLPIISIIGLFADGLTDLKHKFNKIFPSLTFDRLMEYFGQDNIKIKKILIIVISKLCRNLRYGEYYQQLNVFLMQNLTFDFNPESVFSTLSTFVNEYPTIAFPVMESVGFLFRSEEQQSVFDMFIQCVQKQMELDEDDEHILKRSIQKYNKFAYFTLQFIKTCYVKQSELTEHVTLLANLPVDSMCDAVFKIDSYPQTICIVLEMIILKFRKERATWVLKLFYDHIENHTKICELITNGPFNIKCLLMQIVNLIMSELYLSNTDIPFASDQLALLDEHTPFSDSIINPEFVSTVADLLHCCESELIEEVIIFLDSILSRPDFRHNPDLILPLLSEDVVEVLNSFLLDHENPKLAEIADHLLSLLHIEEQVR